MFKGNRNGFGSPGRTELRLRKIFNPVVAAFDLNVGTGKLNGFEGHLIVENDDERNRFE